MPNQPSFSSALARLGRKSMKPFLDISKKFPTGSEARVSKSKRDRILAWLFLCLEFFQCLPRRSEIPHFVQWTLFIRYSVDHGLKLGIGHLAVPG